MPNQSKCDYSKSIIYKIMCLDRSIKDIYVGSTTNFASRKTKHKSDCNNPNDNNYNLFVYQFIRAHGGWDNWEIVPIKTYSCNSHMELRIEEQRMIEELEEYTTLNRQRAWTSKERRAELDSTYPCRELTHRREIGRKSYQNRREKIIEYQKEYASKNKDKIKAYKTKKIICECGTTLTKANKLRHLKSIKHQTWEEQPEPNLIFVD